MSNTHHAQKRVVFIGAAGGVCQVAVKCFAAASTVPLVLSDINTAVLDSLQAELPSGRATTLKLDLFDPVALRDAIKGAGLVVLGAGPYMRTAEPVIKGCIEAKIPYLDFDDDVESTQVSLDLHETAKEAGIPCFINCGASPGMTNVMALDVAKELDSIDVLDICWLTGHGGFYAGKAVLEHLLHIAAGPCLTWENGRPTVHETFLETTYVPMVGSAGEQPLHETAHPEPITLVRAFPKANRIRCMGGLDPPLKMGIARGLATAHRRGDITIEDAVEFYDRLRSDQIASKDWVQVLLGSNPGLLAGPLSAAGLWQRATNVGRSLGPMFYALTGVFEQIWKGEVTMSQLVNFVRQASKGETVPYKGALLVRATGTHNGHPAVAIKRTPTCGEGSGLFRSVSHVTGVACAAFMVLALEDSDKTRSGVFAPEDWVEPQVFYKMLEQVGVPSHDIIESPTS
ncbi:hypothetical protein H2204_003352 [Knufia peltigerae]|uniref:Saccharopine dehydrogenase NADP binding domain-containing protein n=1 Tax=Knufia peltigerae TaxID=1002370 RepID=A0AA39D1W3_9EURO|nr:hypothetical protein H2204_003352 [Knufia peltigerae]